MRISHIAVAVGVVCLVAAGCTTVSKGDPIPESSTGQADPTEAPTSSSGNEDDLPRHGAPKVENPLDVSGIEQDPCLILTAAQTQDLSLSATGKEEEGTVGPICKWYNSDTRGSVLAAFLINGGIGLSGVYAAHERGDTAYFEPLPPIEDFPAVASDGIDRRERGTCPVTVGVNDQRALNVTVTLSGANIGKKDPCETAAMVAGMALRTIKTEI